MKIIDIIHMYIGCFVIHVDYPERKMKIHFVSEGGSVVIGRSDDFQILKSHHKLLLRPLHAMDDLDREKLIFSSKRHFDEYCKYHDGAFDPVTTLKLCRLGFDIFGLIPAGLAVDATLLIRQSKE